MKMFSKVLVFVFALISFATVEISVEGGANARITKSGWSNFRSIEHNYLGIWSFKTRAKNISKINKEIETLIKNEMSYNFDFDLEAKNKMYYSQFIASRLNKLKKFNFAPTKIKLNPTYQSLLKIEYLNYYLADFFIRESAFKLIYETF